MKIIKIIEINSKHSCDKSKEIKQEINNYWQAQTENGESRQFAEAFYLLENENLGRLIITKNQARYNPAFETIYKTLKDNDAHELHYYFHKN